MTIQASCRRSTALSHACLVATLRSLPNRVIMTQDPTPPELTQVQSSPPNRPAQTQHIYQLDKNFIIAIEKNPQCQPTKDADAPDRTNRVLAKSRLQPIQERYQNKINPAVSPSQSPPRPGMETQRCKVRRLQGGKKNQMLFPFWTRVAPFSKFLRQPKKPIAQKTTVNSTTSTNDERQKWNCPQAKLSQVAEFGKYLLFAVSAASFPFRSPKIDEH
jgi:hypothetical protein